MEDRASAVARYRKKRMRYPRHRGIPEFQGRPSAARHRIRVVCIPRRDPEGDRTRLVRSESRPLGAGGFQDFPVRMQESIRRNNSRDADLCAKTRGDRVQESEIGVMRQSGLLSPAPSPFVTLGASNVGQRWANVDIETDCT